MSIRSALASALVVGALSSGCAPPPMDCSEGRATGCQSTMDAGQIRPPPPLSVGRILPAPARSPSPDDVCEAADVDRWAQLHRDGRFIAALRSCSVNDLCDGVPCTFSDCLRAEAGAASCNGCVTEEIACVLASCREACAGNGVDVECLACLCEAQCAVGFAACAGRSLDVCRGCPGRPVGCAPSPALIMVIVD